MEANSLDVRVLGTEFGVRAYQDETCIRTTLKKGKVSVENKGSGIVLTPGMQASFDKETSKMDVQEVNVNLFLAWKDGRLVFAFAEVLHLLEDTGCVEFDIEDNIVIVK